MITVSGVTKTFGALVAIQDICFKVGRGEIFAFLGPNGAGKTTTISILTSLLKPTSGRVEIDGLDAVKNAKETRKRFGIVFQSETLVRELTAYENMDIYGSLYRVPRKLRAGRIKNLLDLFDLWERRDDPVTRFSGGMRRRLEIARCLLHSPKIIFLDEPTVGLDPQTRHLLWDQVTKINQQEGVTVFLTTHYLEEVEQVAHCIAVIDHGKIIAQGSAAQLKQQTTGDTLEEAFLKLTGLSIRPEKVTNLDRLRNVAKVPSW